MHDASAEEMGDVIGEAKVPIKNRNEVADRRICSESVQTLG